MFEGQIVAVCCIYVAHKHQTTLAPCTPLPDLAVGVSKIIYCDPSRRRLQHNALELLPTAPYLPLHSTL